MLTKPLSRVPYADNEVAQVRLGGLMTCGRSGRYQPIDNEVAQVRLGELVTGVRSGRYQPLDTEFAQVGSRVNVRRFVVIFLSTKCFR
jgi:hypothetical protein